MYLDIHSSYTVARNTVCVTLFDLGPRKAKKLVAKLREEAEEYHNKGFHSSSEYATTSADLICLVANNFGWKGF